MAITDNIINRLISDDNNKGLAESFIDRVPGTGLAGKRNFATVNKDADGNVTDAILTYNDGAEITGDQLNADFFAKLMYGIFNTVYPVGSIYITNNDDDDPQKRFGGNWQEIGSNWMLKSVGEDICADSNLDDENKKITDTNSAGNITLKKEYLPIDSIETLDTYIKKGTTTANFEGSVGSFCCQGWSKYEPGQDSSKYPDNMIKTNTNQNYSKLQPSGTSIVFKNPGSDSDGTVFKPRTYKGSSATTIPESQRANNVMSYSDTARNFATYAGSTANRQYSNGTTAFNYNIDGKTKFPDDGFKFDGTHYHHIKLNSGSQSTINLFNAPVNSSDGNSTSTDDSTTSTDNSSTDDSLIQTFNVHIWVRTHLASYTGSETHNDDKALG